MNCARALFFLLALLASPVFADTDSDALVDRYPFVKDYFPEADRYGPFSGSPPAAVVLHHKRLLGYLFFSKDVIAIPAYSGEPINNLIGLRVNGQIAGVAVVEHEEPLLLGGIPPTALERFVQQYRGKSFRDQIVIGAASPGQVEIDAVTGATITFMIENATVMQAARVVAESRGLPRAPAAAAPTRPRAVERPQRVVPTQPAAVRAGESAKTEPLWRAVWRERSFRIAILAAGLFLLTLILLFQDWLARHPRLLVYVRQGFLLYTVLFIGWYALGQLSVVNVLTFVHAVMSHFSWESFLVEPIVFILWSFVAVTLLLWGRGVYCGWLCPFGAVQELVQQAARKFNLPQFEFPRGLHERLWALKYVILLALFAISLQSLGDAARYAEIEPFKTVNMHFARDWGYGAFALGLIAVSAFNRKLYCKYICPLGAALTIPARFRIFDWLRRRKECGNPCQICANECEVQAMLRTGEINANECHYCLDCQVTYWNDQKCPPLCEKRKRRERSARAHELAAGMAPELIPPRKSTIPIQPAPPEPPPSR